MLKILKENKFLLDGNMINLPEKELGKFLIGCLDLPIEIESDLTLEELIHSLYPIKNHITERYSEEYEVLRSLIMMGKFNKSYQKLEIYKSLFVEDGFLKISCNFELIDGNNGFDKISELCILMKDNVVVEDENFPQEIKTQFLFNELISVLFDDFIDSIRYDGILK